MDDDHKYMFILDLVNNAFLFLVIQALSFKEAFVKAQESLAAADTVAADDAKSNNQDATVSSTTSLAAMFKPAAGSWECDTCLVRNKAESNACVSCSSNKPGYEPPKDSPLNFNFGVSGLPASIMDTKSSSSQQKDSETKPVSLSSMFKPAVGSWVCTTCLVCNNAGETICVACGTSLAGVTPAEPTPDTKPAFSFGIKADTPASTSSSSSQFSFGIKDSKPAFTFGTPQTSQSMTVTSTQSTFKFGAVKPSQDSATSDTKTTFSFGISGDQTNKPFSFSFNNTSTVVSSTASSTSSTIASAFSAPSFTTTGPVPIPAGPQEHPTTPTKNDNSGFVFGSPGKYEFSFSGVKAKSPRSRDVSLCESEDGVLNEDEGDHLYFEVSIR